MDKEKKEYLKAWKKANSERVRETDRRFKERHRERLREKDRQRKARDPLKYSWTFYRRNAKLRGLMFTLTREEHDKIVLGACVYCGLLAYPVNGIDRIDNSIGYILSNAASCCKKCNFMKGSLSSEDFLNQVSLIARMRG